MMIHTVESKSASLAAQALQRLDYANFDNDFQEGVFIPDATLKIKMTISRGENTNTVHIGIYRLRSLSFKERYHHKTWADDNTTYRY